MSAVFYRSIGSAYPMATRGEGVYLYDSEDKQYLDMSGGAAVSSLGHGHPEIIRAVQRQVETLAFAHTSFFTNEPQEDLAERLAARFPEQNARAWFTSGGSESNETALKLAWQYWRARGKADKTIVISREFSYHGGTLGAASISGAVSRRIAFEKVLHNWPRIAPCFAYRHQLDGESAADYGQRVAQELDTAIRSAGADNVAVFIAEPVVGATLGAAVAVDGYFKEIRRICDEHDVLFIADEVMCGSGRTGTFYACEQEDVVPDMVTLAKGLGGGYQPLGAVLARERICETIRQDKNEFAHGHTYIGHATACAAGVAIQECLDQDDLLKSVRGKGESLMSVLQDAFGDHPYVGDIRGRGLFAGIEFVADRETKKPFPAEDKLAAKIFAATMDAGLICYPGHGTAGGFEGAHIMLAPPFIAEDKHFAELTVRLGKVIDQAIGKP